MASHDPPPDAPNTAPATADGTTQAYSTYAFPSADSAPLYAYHTATFLAAPSIAAAHGWHVYARKGAIMSADEIDRAYARLRIPIPEMIFGKNYVVMQHAPSGWTLGFNSVDALDRVAKHGNPDGGLVKVAYSETWMKDKSKSPHNLHDVVKPFDWTYTTDYRGTLTAPTALSQFTPTTDRIPIHKLRLPDPILFFDDVVLFEDELGDNGVSMYTVKLRVMPARMLVLARFFMRVDDVLFRVRDTRVFVEFEEGVVLREYTVRQADYAAVRQKIPGTAKDVGLFLRDSNWITENLPIVEQYTEKATVPTSS
ncbi:type 2A phosphatase [Limtongia smithiae]|uniref:type 2A phosphatase n=1 Tax=Limtongia smithiae TaxID=1125753 RepID=UPI0034CDC512